MSIFIVFLTVIPAFAANTAPTAPHSNAACVYNIENNTFVYEKNSTGIVYPTSTVKLMTAILAVEALGNDLNRKITVTNAAVKNIAGNNIALVGGEVLTAEQLLYALICGCANDAARVLAIEVAGSVEEFVNMMNSKAQEIGAKSTYYTNPTGVHDPQMITTAADTALIGAYAAKIQLIRDMSSVAKYTIPRTNKRGERIIHNKNYYFSTYYETKYYWALPKGLNSGYTNEGGYCLVSSAAQNGLTYITVIMGSYSDDDNIYSYVDATELTKWALRTWEYKKIVSTSDMICEIPVKLASKVDHVGLFPAENVELFLPADEDVSSKLILKPSVTADSFIAPVEEGRQGGTLEIIYDGREIGTVELVTRSSVSRNNILYLLDLVYEVVKTPKFRTACIIAAVLILLYVGYSLFYSAPKKR